MNPLDRSPFQAITIFQRYPNILVAGQITYQQFNNFIKLDFTNIYDQKIIISQFFATSTATLY